MELILKGDYYEWYCDWCDSRNLTLSFRVHEGGFACCACHRVAVCVIPATPATSWQAQEFGTIPGGGTRSELSHLRA